MCFFSSFYGEFLARDFWKTISPFMSDKHSGSNDCISLRENECIIANQNEVANLFNAYFVNITENLAEPNNLKDINTLDLLDHYSGHSSITFIQNYVNQLSITPFAFTPVTNSQVSNKLKGLNCKKAIGYDCIPAKLLKVGADSLSPHLCKLINISYSQEIYPDDLKHAEVVPLFKKTDKFDKANYRPVSILISLSKVVEGSILLF